MTARSGTTAELLSAVAALALASIYNALTYIKLHHNKGSLVYAKWKVVDVTFVVGSIGLVGLTVWNLRVESTVHTCFTSQTIVSICIQCVALCSIVGHTELNKKPDLSRWRQWLRSYFVRLIVAFMLIAMVVYVILFSTADTPLPHGDEYFAIGHHKHAFAQFSFFALYFLALMWLVYEHCNGEYFKIGDSALYVLSLDGSVSPYALQAPASSNEYPSVPQPGSGMQLRRGTVTRW